MHILKIRKTKRFELCQKKVGNSGLRFLVYCRCCARPRNFSTQKNVANKNPLKNIIKRQFQTLKVQLHRRKKYQQSYVTTETNRKTCKQTRASTVTAIKEDCSVENTQHEWVESKILNDAKVYVGQRRLPGEVVRLQCVGMAWGAWEVLEDDNLHQRQRLRSLPLQSQGCHSVFCGSQ